MALVIEAVATILEQAGAGTRGQDLFIGELPAEPEACVVLYELPGRPPDLEGPVDYPDVQVVCRARSYLEARGRAEVAFRALHGLAEQVVDGVRFLLIRAQGSPAPLERDENGRHLISCVYSCTVQNPTPWR